MMQNLPSFCGPDRGSQNPGRVLQTKSLIKHIALLVLGFGFAGMSVPSLAFASENEPSVLVEAPRVVTREQWGARPAVCSFATSDPLPPVRKVVIHHTETREYEYADDAMMWIRSVQEYHIEHNGWCDIGYNFVIDKFGNIYEGVEGSFQEIVQGAHASGFNPASIGIALLGNYKSEEPSPEMLSAAGQLAGWILGHQGVDPEGTWSFVAQPWNSRFSAGATYTLPNIIGHRDVGLTDCPGDAAYAKLPEITSTAEAVASELAATGQFGDGAYGGFQATHILHLAPTPAPIPDRDDLLGSQWRPWRSWLLGVSSLGLFIAIADLLLNKTRRPSMEQKRIDEND